MSLLRDIQNEAIGTETSVSELLRKCSVLASRLDYAPLREWVQKEQNGYGPGDDLPAYRPRITTQVLGNFSGPAGSGMKNMGLAAGNVPEEFRERLFTTEVREPVAEIERLVESGEPHFEIPWPGNVVAALQSRFVEHMNLMDARQIVPATVFSRTLSGIRDRIVQFALDLEAVNADAGEAEPGVTPIPAGTVNQIFSQNFYGDNTAVAAGGRDVTQRQTVTQSRDAITELLTTLGIGEDAIGELFAALDADGNMVGPETRSWLDRLEQGAITVGTSVTAQTAAAAITGLLGVG